MTESAPQRPADPDWLSYWYALVLGAAWDGEENTDGKGPRIDFYLALRHGGLSMASVCCRFHVTPDQAEWAIASVTAAAAGDVGYAQKLGDYEWLYQELLGEFPSLY